MFKNKEGKVRSGWKIAIVMIISLAIIFIVSFIVSFAVSLYLKGTGDMTVVSMTEFTYTKRGESIMGVISVISMFIQEIFFIVVPIFAWRIVTKRRLSDMGLVSFKSGVKELGIGLLFGILSITIVFAALVLTGNAEVSSWTLHFAPEQLLYIFVFISVGFAEEILGRGYIMSVLRQTKNIPVIIIVSAVIFALLHSMNPGIGPLPYINLALFGAFMAYIYLRSGNIWMCIGYHITWNYFQGYVFGFKVSGTNSQGMLTTEFPKANILNGGAFGPEGGLFVTAVILLGLLFVRQYYKNRQFDFLAVDPPAAEPQVEMAAAETSVGAQDTEADSLEAQE